MRTKPKELENRVVILNGFTNDEIMTIMAAVKALYTDVDRRKFAAFVEAAKELPQAGGYSAQVLDLLLHAGEVPGIQSTPTGDLIFAKTTPNSIQMRLQDLIVDMSQDHEYLKKNPPGPAAPKADS
jgi:hypothetical protein